MQANNSADTDVPEQDRPGPAELLRQAREAADLGVDEVAEQLHLSRDVVLALESGEFDVLGAPVFVKGHLRSYARLMELDEKEIVASYQPSEPEPEEFRTLSMQAEVKPAASLSNFVLLVALGVVLLVAAVYLLFGDNEPAEQSDFEEVGVIESPEKPDTSDELVESAGLDASQSASRAEDFAPLPPIDQSAETATESLTAIDAATVPPAGEAPLQPDVASLPVETKIASEPVSEERVANPAQAETVAVSFRFREECWVEVSDARRRLIYGLKKPGHESNFRGVPPFKIFLGNAPSVELEIAGNAYEIPAGGRRGKTARFTIDEDDLR
ncbi:MAG: DUF4115 domain-containing protein [Gammaproteobacteria bacterium]